MSNTLRDNIDWVGYVDWNLRDFHGYQTDRGVTYNAYLIRDEKTALIDTVKAPFAERLLANVAALVDPARVDYVVCNHAESDHASALPRVLEALPHATLVCDERCIATLAEHFDTSAWRVQTIVDGETLRLGRRSLTFLETPMLHWPESMFTYVPEEKLLFSMDAFGQHYASSARFDDEAPLPVVMDEAKTYYANIVMPFGRQVAQALERAASIPIDMIAPSHGVIWRSHMAEILKAYADWSVCRTAPKVVILYDTMWGSTAAMAEAIYDGANQPGVDVVLLHLRAATLTRIATEMLDVATVAFGSSTLNRGMMPMAAAALCYLRGLRPTGKAGFAFGSYGWSAGGPEAVAADLAAMKWQILRDPLTARYRPGPKVLDECRQAGGVLAAKARELAG